MHENTKDVGGGKRSSKVKHYLQNGKSRKLILYSNIRIKNPYHNL